MSSRIDFKALWPRNGHSDSMRLRIKIVATFKSMSFILGSLGEYFGVPAILSDFAVGEKSVEGLIYENWEFMGAPEGWLLGASHNRTTKIAQNQNFKCFDDSCYHKSLADNKICKPGMLLIV